MIVYVDQLSFFSFVCIMKTGWKRPLSDVLNGKYGGNRVALERFMWTMRMDGSGNHLFELASSMESSIRYKSQLECLDVAIDMVCDSRLSTQVFRLGFLFATHGGQYSSAIDDVFVTKLQQRSYLGWSKRTEGRPPFKGVVTKSHGVRRFREPMKHDVYHRMMDILPVPLRTLLNMLVVPVSNPSCKRYPLGLIRGIQVMSLLDDYDMLVPFLEMADMTVLGQASLPHVQCYVRCYGHYTDPFDPYVTRSHCVRFIRERKLDNHTAFNHVYFFSPVSFVHIVDNILCLHPGEETLCDECIKVVGSRLCGVRAPLALFFTLHRKGLRYTHLNKWGRDVIDSERIIARHRLDEMLARKEGKYEEYAIMIKEKLKEELNLATLVTDTRDLLIRRRGCGRPLYHPLVHLLYHDEDLCFSMMMVSGLRLEFVISKEVAEKLLVMINTERNKKMLGPVRHHNAMNFITPFLP